MPGCAATAAESSRRARRRMPRARRAATCSGSEPTRTPACRWVKRPQNRHPSASRGSKPGGWWGG